MSHYIVVVTNTDEKTSTAFDYKSRQAMLQDFEQGGGLRAWETIDIYRSEYEGEEHERIDENHSLYTKLRG